MGDVAGPPGRTARQCLVEDADQRRHDREQCADVGRHEQPEVYLVLEGSGVVTIDGSTRRVDAGAAVFIPGNAAHSIECTSDTDLRVAYAFAADAFEDVEYVFSA